ncbi:unnamed protein product [Cuscuta epithymum]|uniref:Uncharacterized protein n=1 Tax=Cuscuta epithymum TaxID=186058 RepID=A0AAV0EEQ0_9ASTE|nr:unnamed protein product [Cuscuta epithymum]
MIVIPARTNIPWAERMPLARTLSTEQKEIEKNATLSNTESKVGVVVAGSPLAMTVHLLKAQCTWKYFTMYTGNHHHINMMIGGLLAGRGHRLIRKHCKFTIAVCEILCRGYYYVVERQSNLNFGKALISHQLWV